MLFLNTNTFKWKLVTPHILQRLCHKWNDHIENDRAYEYYSKGIGKNGRKYFVDKVVDVAQVQIIFIFKKMQ